MQAVSDSEQNSGLVPDQVDQPLHPIDAHLKRDSIPKSAGIHVVVLTESEAVAEQVGISLQQLIREAGREVEVVIEPHQLESRAERLLRALKGATAPLVLVTTACEVWTKEHLESLLQAIDRVDLAIGRRPESLPVRVFRWLLNRPWALLFAVPARDPDSPCWLFRREAIEIIPAQSASRFLNIEILAKLSYFALLIDEVDVPGISGASGPPGFLDDFFEVLKNPVIRKEPSEKGNSAGVAASLSELAPSEDPEREEEGNDAPDRQNRQLGENLNQAGTLENDEPERIG